MSSIPGPEQLTAERDLTWSGSRVDLLLHGWDLAQATGRPLHVSDEVVAYVREIGDGLIKGGRGRSFGEEVAPAADASPVDAFAAYAGRTRITA